MTVSNACDAFGEKDICSSRPPRLTFLGMAGEAVLVVEQEPGTRAFLEQQLTDDGFEVVSAEQARKALELVERARPDLVLLDAVLPDASGFEVCSRLREGEPGRTWNRDVPVIIVSARSEPVDRLRGFARGCDDYVPKPFLYEELVARMRAVLRRANGPRRTTLSVRDLTVDLGSRTVRVAGERLQLSAKEYDLLVALAEDPERVYRKEELLRNVWGFRSLGRTRTLDSHASRLRRKLNNGSDPTYVLNVWGVGYRLVAATE
jgi:DNA-binding response OmpR family regulator